MKPTNRNKHPLIRLLSLSLVIVTVLLLLSGCAANGSTQATTEEGLVDVSKLSSETRAMSVFDYIKLPFAYLLEWLYRLTQSYGLALIIFAVIVKVFLIPASAMSKKGMMKMSRLTPKVKALEKKYADDKEKYQQEVNKLYREEGAGGCGGCIWSLLPMLILIPLYQIIREPITWLMFHGNVSEATLAEIKNVFLAHKVSAVQRTSFYWQMQALPYIKNYLPELQAISGKIFSMNTRFLGIELATVPRPLFWKYFDEGTWNVIGQFLLPIVSGAINWISMWISQKLNNTVIVNDKGEQDEEMAKQNQSSKMMTMMMPFMSIYIGFIAPAGLSLYWIVQGVFSLVQDYFLTKHYKKIYDAEDAVKQEEAARQAAAEAERERIRAEKRAENPEGITGNTSKKKLQQRERNEQAAKEAAYQAAKLTQEEREEELERKLQQKLDEERPFRRGRNFRADRYAEAEETNTEDSDE